MKKNCYIKLTVTIQKDREEDCWLARCVELGTSTFGDTIEEAEEAIVEAIELHIEGLIKQGELIHFFKENNIHLFDKKPVDVASIDVPLTPNTYAHPLIRSIEQKYAMGVC